MHMFFDVDNERTRAEKAKYDGVNLACSACLSEDTVETSELIPSGRNYRIRCELGHVTNGIPPAKFRNPYVGCTDPTDVKLPYVPQSTDTVPWFILAAEQWEEVADLAGFTVAESTFDYTTIDDSADEDTAVEGVRIGDSWYLVRLDGNSVRADFARKEVQA